MCLAFTIFAKKFVAVGTDSFEKLCHCYSRVGFSSYPNGSHKKIYSVQCFLELVSQCLRIPQ